MKTLNFISFFIIAFLSCNNNTNVIEKKKDCLINNEVVFTEIAEKILFNKFGKENIQKQKPYTIKFVNDSIWTIKGNLDFDTDGGVFYLEMNCKDAKIIKIEHSK